MASPARLAGTEVFSVRLFFSMSCTSVRELSVSGSSGPAGASVSDSLVQETNRVPAASRKPAASKKSLFFIFIVILL